jgi:hypothetical protein
MLKIVFILAGIALIYCLWVAIAFFLALSRESQLPDIEDVEIAD